ncbi:MAG: class I SAM-dependent methyltransferase [Gemmataceae bacterium]|nr:class I SAM-dependent methyltransferase [Gemmataceae bacterium]
MNLLRSLVPPALRPVARRARAVLRGLAPVHHAGPFPPADLRAAVRPVRALPPLEAGRAFEVALSVTNHSPRAVGPNGPCPVGVRLAWRSYAGEPVAAADGFAPLPRPLWPGEELARRFTFPAPAALGDYRATFALAQKGGPDFEPVGPPAVLDLAVSHPLDGGFNYHDIYGRADLNRDFWTASGPPSRAEFERLAPVKLQLLTDRGLTPDGRILDVGCGTGLLATAAERFLSDRGAYFGTDLAPEAVAFCKGRYRRPNFRFAVNGMTTVPVRGERFDAITFFSVFTHTYPDETALLLAEAARLLAPGGFVFADAFTSPLVQRHAGSRYAVEVNREALLRLAGLSGLTAERVVDSPWNGPARREFFAFRRG